jgi:hypothetical protein
MTIVPYRIIKVVENIVPILAETDVSKRLASMSKRCSSQLSLFFSTHSYALLYLLSCHKKYASKYQNANTGINAINTCCVVPLNKSIPATRVMAQPLTAND